MIETLIAPYLTRDEYAQDVASSSSWTFGYTYERERAEAAIRRLEAEHASSLRFADSGIENENPF